MDFPGVLGILYGNHVLIDKTLDDPESYLDWKKYSVRVIPLYSNILDLPLFTMLLILPLLKSTTVTATVMWKY